MPDTTNNEGYLVQLRSPEGDNVYPIISAEMIKDKDGNVYNLPELFQSVSEGKALVASAITDKGVITAADATFQQMATNVESIPVLDTSDANATASRILSGYTAYVNGVKISGSMVNRGAVSGSVSPGGSYTIPAGYHNGSGKVTGSGQSYPFSGNFRTIDITTSSVGTYLPSDTWLIPMLDVPTSGIEDFVLIKINGTWHWINCATFPRHLIRVVDNWSFGYYGSISFSLDLSSSTPKIERVNATGNVSSVTLYYL